MNYSRKHKKVAFTKHMQHLTGICCSRQFIYWCGQNNLSVDEIRYLINDGWHLEKSPSKSFKLHSSAVYGKTVKELM